MFRRTTEESATGGDGERSNSFELFLQRHRRWTPPPLDEHVEVLTWIGHGHAVGKSPFITDQDPAAQAPSPPIRFLSTTPISETRLQQEKQSDDFFLKPLDQAPKIEHQDNR
ncbi:hypothetical protein TIFTF001_032003 [Ficus carica]|uniref:Uncharacterized protein n=1 Tax=Ficus carica TaxID=3494 RepID=A0AA88DW68_FICCA|nr:hypothetical protein TIFTF001_031958 [Ficus carica]GMN62918.1 hypothetical protein TIFTF001_032003 [Ficus carica]